MGEILIAVVIIIVAVFAFAVWLCARVIGLIIRAFTGGPKPRQTDTARRLHEQPALPWHADVVACPQPLCYAANAPHARFCRRCGKAVSAVAAGAGVMNRPASMRYVA
jgi:hypothetical protein